MEDGLCRFLRIAKKESLKSHAPYKLGCVIVQKRKIIGRGYNLYRTDPRMGVGYHQYYHAETKALKEALSLKAMMSRVQLRTSTVKEDYSLNLVSIVKRYLGVSASRSLCIPKE